MLQFEVVPAIGASDRDVDFTMQAAYQLNSRIIVRRIVEAVIELRQTEFILKKDLFA